MDSARPYEQDDDAGMETMRAEGNSFVQAGGSFRETKKELNSTLLRTHKNTYTDNASFSMPSFASLNRDPNEQYKYSDMLMKLPSTLVSDGRPSQLNNPFRDKFAYNNVKQVGFAEASPSVVHFGGYELGKVYTQYVHIINVSDKSQRVHILDPDTTWFKIKYRRKGVIAPGMTEDVAITFTPFEFRYHYDQLRVHLGDRNLVVPIHAYPIMNSAIFPAQVDMGNCPLGAKAVKVIPLECKVPVRFNFQLQLRNSTGQEFTVSPLSGTIAGNGVVNITIEYTPKRNVTSHAQLEVNISQLGFKPFVCHMFGNSSPDADITADHLSAAMSYPEEGAEGTYLDYQGLSQQGGGSMIHNKKKKKNIFVKASVNRLGSAPIGGRKKKTGEDGEADADEDEDDGKNGSSDEHGHGSTKDEEEVIVQGIRVPRGRKLFTQSAVNYILNQVPGKLRLKDVKAAAAEHTRRLQQMEDQVSKIASDMAAGGDKKKKKQQQQQHHGEGESGRKEKKDHLKSPRVDRSDEKLLVEYVDPPPFEIKSMPSHKFDYSEAPDVDMSFPGDTRQMREMIFLRNLLDYSKHETSVKINPTKQLIGHILMTMQQRTSLENARFFAQAHEQELAREEQRRQTKHHLLDDRPIYMVAQRLSDTRFPVFDKFDNAGLWDMRQRIVAKFAKSVTKLVIRQRVVARAKAIKLLLIKKGLLPLKGKDTDETGAPAAASSLSSEQRSDKATQGEDDEGESADTEIDDVPKEFRLSTPSFLMAPSFPVAAPVVSDDVCGPVAVPLLPTFVEVNPLVPIAPWEFKKLGYFPVPMEPWPSYVMLEVDRPFRSGALDELSTRLPRGPPDHVTELAVAEALPGLVDVTATRAVATSLIDAQEHQAGAGVSQAAGAASGAGGKGGAAAGAAAASVSAAGAGQGGVGGSALSRLEGKKRAELEALQEQERWAEARCVMPVSLRVPPLPSHALESLRTDPCMVVLSQLIPYAETSAEFAFRPTQLGRGPGAAPSTTLNAEEGAYAAQGACARAAEAERREVQRRTDAIIAGDLEEFGGAPPQGMGIAHSSTASLESTHNLTRTQVLYPVATYAAETSARIFEVTGVLPDPAAEGPGANERVSSSSSSSSSGYAPQSRYGDDTPFHVRERPGTEALESLLDVPTVPFGAILPALVAGSSAQSLLQTQGTGSFSPSTTHSFGQSLGSSLNSAMANTLPNAAATLPAPSSSSSSFSSSGANGMFNFNTTAAGDMWFSSLVGPVPANPTVSSSQVYASVSSLWLPQVDDMLSFHFDEVGLQINGQLLRGPAKEDDMSDSENDEYEEDLGYKAIIPSEFMCRNIFTSDKMAGLPINSVDHVAAGKKTDNIDATATAPKADLSKRMSLSATEASTSALPSAGQLIPDEDPRFWKGNLHIGQDRRTCAKEHLLPGRQVVHTRSSALAVLQEKETAVRTALVISMGDKTMNNNLITKKDGFIVQPMLI